MKIQKRYASESYCLSNLCRPSIKAVTSLWYNLNVNNSWLVFLQFKKLAYEVAKRTPPQYQSRLKQVASLFRRDYRNIKVVQARQENKCGNSRKLAAKYRVKPFDFEL